MDKGRNRDRDDDTAPYLPERYRRHVNAKKQQKLIKKILITSGIVVLLFVSALVVFGGLPGIQLPALPAPPAILEPLNPPKMTPPVGPAANLTAPALLAITYGPGMQQVTAGSGLLPPEIAIDLIRLEYPAPEYTLVSVNLTGHAGKKIYEFMIRPRAGAENPAMITVGIDAISGEPYTPGQETAKTVAEQARRIAGNAFLYLKPDQIRVRYHTLSDNSRSWDFVLVKENVSILSGSLDPETGKISSFLLQVSPDGRPARPILTMADARTVADRTIAGWNGQIPVVMNSGLYEPIGDASSPVAGRYVFEYNRIAQDQPCDVDGFTVAVDSVSGEVMEYERRWSDPDNAFSFASDPVVTKRDATFVVLQNASEIAPQSVQSIQILTVRLLWKDRHSPGLTPRPGTIPLAWKVTFDDAPLRARSPPEVATGWVDVKTGAILEMDYRH
ncbi:MAG: hypothetical protein WC586_01265 [Methanoregula sp.]